MECSEARRSPEWGEAMDASRSIQTTVAKALDGECESVRKRLRSSKASVSACYSAIRFFVIGLFATWLVPKLLSTGPVMTAQSASGVSESIARLVAFLIFFFSVALFIFVFWLVDLCVSRFPNARSPIVLVQSFLLVPALIIGIDRGVDYLLRGVRTEELVNNLLSSYLSLTITLNFLLFFLVVVVRTGAIPAPGYLILNASDRISPEVPWAQSSRDVMIEEVVQKTYEVFEGWSEAKIQRVGYLIGKKAAGQTAQLQAIAPISGFLGLLSLLALVFSSEQVGNVIRGVSNTFAQASTDPQHSFLTIAIAAVVAVAALGVGYLVRTHRILRVLEIIDIMCEMKLEEPRKTRGSSPEQSTDDSEKIGHSPLLTSLFSLFWKVLR